MKHALDHREFRHFFSSYKSLVIGDLLFRYRFENNANLGLIVSKKYGNAVNRNLFKRRCRSLFYKFFIKKDVVLVVQPLKSTVSWNTLLKGFFSIHKKLI